MRSGLKIALGAAIAVAVVGATGAASFGPIIRSRVRAHAAARGVQVEVGQVLPGLGRVWLRDVRVSIPQVPAVDATLDHVEVRVGPTLCVRRVVVSGGTVDLDGTQEEIQKQVRAWRAGQPTGTGAATGSRTYSASGLRLTWKGAFRGAAGQEAWGLSYDRAEDGVERIGADLVRVSRRGVSLEMKHPFLELSRRNGDRALTRIGAGSVTGRLDLGAINQKVPEAKHPAAAKGAAGAPGPALRSHLSRVGSVVAELLPANAELELSSLRLELYSAGQTLTVGPAHLALRRASDRMHLDLMPGEAEQRTPLAMRLDLPLRRGSATFELDGGPVSLAALGIAEGSFGLLDVAETDVLAKGRVKLDEKGDRITFDGTIRIEGLNLSSPRLALSPVRNMSIGWRGKGEISGDLSRIELERSELNFGKTRFEIAGDLEWEDDKLVRGELTGGVPLASCQSMIGSAPGGLLPLLQGAMLTGTFSLHATASFDFSKHTSPAVTWDMANDCRVGSVPPSLDPSRFAGSWVREVLGADGRPVTVETGPGTPAWVPLEAISRHMPTAIVICEDARFYRHNGFDQEAIASAIRDNLKAGKFVRGASTVSMQLAKNLYLARDKTASRKLQEAVLTVLLEQSLSKDQLMELYLNVIEFGPGIYGIGPAAAYYFNSTAGQLSLGQSLYLASILPNPRSHHFNADGTVTDKWQAYLYRLMRIAHKIHRISEAELEEGLQEVVAFQRPYEPQAAPFDPSVPPDTAGFGQPDSFVSVPGQP